MCDINKWTCYVQELRMTAVILEQYLCSLENNGCQENLYKLNGISKQPIECYPMCARNFRRLVAALCRIPRKFPILPSSMQGIS